jgi:hypothetical protein
MSDKPEPTQLMQLPTMTRAEIANLVACVDAVVRGKGLEAAETCLALAAKLSAATPIEAAPTEQT